MHNKQCKKENTKQQQIATTNQIKEKKSPQASAHANQMQTKQTQTPTQTLAKK